MTNNEVFEAFNSGVLTLPQGETLFSDIPWSKHPVFEGVELKHILISKDTGGAFSFHLVRIAPEKNIGSHVHGTQLETHEVISGSGTCVNDGISIFPAGVPHEVHAGKDGLNLFAKFFPALC
jgi:mannose-6-phosphate isomerase-like protein (cupin superfamily)